MLAVLVYVSIAVRAVNQATYETCAALRSEISEALVDTPTYVDLGKGNPLSGWRVGSQHSFATITSINQVNDFMLGPLPNALWSSLQDQPESDSSLDESQTPAVVAGQNILFGGMRFRQRRVNPSYQERCVPPPFVSPDPSYVRSTYSNVETITLSVLLDAIASTGWRYFARTYTIFDIADYFLNITGSNLNASVLYSLRAQKFNSSVPLGLGLTLINPADVDLGADDPEAAANISELSQFIFNLRSTTGNVSNCFAELSDATESQTNFGALSPNSSLNQPPILAAIDGTSTEGQTLPARPPGLYGGLLEAFVWRSATQVGAADRSVGFAPVPTVAGFEFYLPNAMTRNDYFTAYNELWSIGWFDRMTRKFDIDMILLNPTFLRAAVVTVRSNSFAHPSYMLLS